MSRIDKLYDLAAPHFSAGAGPAAPRACDPMVHAEPEQVAL